MYLYWLVAVAGEVLCEETDDETSPKTGGDTEEDLPVVHKAGWVLSEDAREGGWQCAVGDGEHSLQQTDCKASRAPKHLQQTDNTASRTPRGRWWQTQPAAGRQKGIKDTSNTIICYIDAARAHGLGRACKNFKGYSMGWLDHVTLTRWVQRMSHRLCGA